MTHKHKFEHIGGGCKISSGDKFPCDDHYECKCGMEFKVLTTKLGHRFLPETINEEEMSETKKEEQAEILNADFNY